MIAFLLAKSVPVKVFVGLLTLIALAGLLWAAIAIHDRNVVKQHDATVNARVIAKITPANDHAADQRSTDAITNTRNEQEAHDVVKAAPDARPAPSTVAIGCHRLQRQGTPRDKLPAACRH